MMINSFIVAGRLTKSVQYGATKNGIPAARFNLANNRGKHTNYFQIMAFNTVADYAHHYLHKGQRVTVQGQMQHTTVKADGKYNDYFTVIADTFDPVHPKKQSSSVKKLYSRVDALTKKVDAASQVTKRHAPRLEHHKQKRTKSPKLKRRLANRTGRLNR